MLEEDGQLSKYLRDTGSDDGGEDRIEEEDLKDDPIYTLDLPVRASSLPASFAVSELALLPTGSSTSVLSTNVRSQFERVQRIGGTVLVLRGERDSVARTSVIVALQCSEVPHISEYNKRPIKIANLSSLHRIVNHPTIPPLPLLPLLL